MIARGKRLVVAGVVAVILLIAISASAQIYRYYKPGSVFTLTLIKVNSGMDAAYLQYLDTQLKKDSEAQIKAKYMKSYRILRSLDDDEAGWNLIILREYESLAAFEANEEKADALSREVLSEDDQKQMQGYTDRSKVRQIVATKTMRESILK